MKLYFTTDFLCELIDRTTKKVFFSEIIRIKHIGYIHEGQNIDNFDFTKNIGVTLDFKNVILSALDDRSKFVPSLKNTVKTKNFYIDICQLSNTTHTVETDVKNDNNPYLIKIVDNYCIVNMSDLFLSK
jgi:hypothetical protein